MAKCTFCNSCTVIKSFTINDIHKRFYVCMFCGRVYVLEGDKLIETNNGDIVRDMLGIRKISGVRR